MSGSWFVVVRRRVLLMPWLHYEASAMFNVQYMESGRAWLTISITHLQFSVHFASRSTSSRHCVITVCSPFIVVSYTQVGSRTHESHVIVPPDVCLSAGDMSRWCLTASFSTRLALVLCWRDSVKRYTTMMVVYMEWNKVAA